MITLDRVTYITCRKPIQDNNYIYKLTRDIIIKHIGIKKRNNNIYKDDERV